MQLEPLSGVVRILETILILSQTGTIPGRGIPYHLQVESTVQRESNTRQGDWIEGYWTAKWMQCTAKLDMIGYSYASIYPYRHKCQAIAIIAQLKK